MESLKCLVIGPPVCGKTSLIHTYMSGYFCGYIPQNILTRYDVNFVCKPTEQDQNKSPLNFQFKLYDYEIEKSNSFQFLKEDELNKIDVILLCYQTFSDSSKYLLRTKFKNAIKSKWPDVPVLLVSCFSDLLKSNPSSLANNNHDDKSLNFLDDDLSRIQILDSDKCLMKEIGAVKHYYCSALEKYNIDRLFRDAFKIAVKHRIYNNVTKVNQKSKTTKPQENVKKIQSVKVKSSIELPNTIEQNSIQLKQTFIKSKNKSQNYGFSLIKFLVTLFLLIFMVIYLLSIRYCVTNKEHCNEIYELSLEAIDESMTSLNQSYTNFFYQLKRLS